MKASTLKLWQLISPALPVGAYSYSQALEYAHHAGLVHDESTTRVWLAELLRYGLAFLDLPVLLRVHRAWSSGDARRAALEPSLEARRETAELRFEDLAMGSALAQLLDSFGQPIPDRRCLLQARSRWPAPTGRCGRRTLPRATRGRGARPRSQRP